MLQIPKLENLIADRINLKISKGSCIGFVGKSGAGKSTLIDILIGLLTPLSGDIKIDNETIDVSSRAWQKLIGYVSQSVYLSDDTIKKILPLVLMIRKSIMNLLIILLKHLN